MSTSEMPSAVAWSTARPRRADTRLPPGSTLFSLIVGELLNDLRAGCRLANRIEEELIRRHWPAGTMYGSESELCDRFQVGRAVVREALRVLEVRGCARMRRGPNGGLQVLRPGRAQCVEMAADYLQLLGVDQRQIDEAQRMLGRVRAQLDDSGRRCSSPLQPGELAHINTIVLPFFEELIEAIRQLIHERSDALAGSKARPLFQRSRAGQIARRLMMECTPQEWARGTRLGSTFDLCERYDISRDVVRQAIRILESAGMAMSLSGRGHGIVSQAPRPGSMCRLISCHFAAHGLSRTAAMGFFHCMSVEAIAKAAKLADADEVDCIQRAFDRAVRALEGASEEELAAAIFEVEERQFSVLNNPLIDLFLRSTKAFPAWEAAGIGESVVRNQIYLAGTRQVVAAIARRDAAAAAHAQELKNHRLAEIVEIVPAAARLVS